MKTILFSTRAFCQTDSEDLLSQSVKEENCQSSITPVLTVKQKRLFNVWTTYNGSQSFQIWVFWNMVSQDSHHNVLLEQYSTQMIKVPLLQQKLSSQNCSTVGSTPWNGKQSYLVWEFSVTWSQIKNVHNVFLFTVFRKIGRFKLTLQHGQKNMTTNNTTDH